MPAALARSVPLLFFAGLTLSAQPAIRASQPVLQAFDNGPRLSPGAWLQLFGSNLAASSRAWTAADFQGDRAPTTLDDVGVRVNGSPSPVAYISPGQINFQAPTNLVAGSTATIEAVRDGVVSNSVTLSVMPASPALLTSPSFLIAGKQYAAALQSDLRAFVGRPNLIGGESFRPGRPGSLIVLYAVGCGPSTPSVEAGRVVAAIAPLALPVEVKFGATTAQARAYLEPGAIGLCRFDVTVPDVRGDSLGDIAIEVSVGGVATGQRLFTNIRSSELAQVMSAAFLEFANSGSVYSALHKKHFGVTQDAPRRDDPVEWIDGGKITPGLSLAAVLDKGAIRFGYVPEFPLHSVAANGVHSGFDYELGEEVARRIAARYGRPLQVEWVSVDITIPMGASKEPTIYNALLGGLKSGRFDAAFESAQQDDGSVAYTSPIYRMFPGIVYTGRDNLNVSGILGRASLVRFLIDHPGLTFITGAGRAVFDALAVEVAAGGSSVIVVDGTAGANPHFRLADVLGIAKQFADGLLNGVLLDVNARLDIDPRAPFVLADR
jgi:uncharacterized protein (TIGR03437 family)